MGDTLRISAVIFQNIVLCIGTATIRQLGQSIDIGGHLIQNLFHVAASLAVWVITSLSDSYPRCLTATLAVWVLPHRQDM